jgi:GPH family glycoside/pentoside/hexuronide:cation symporter/probable glucitol transport protein GutA
MNEVKLKARQIWGYGVGALGQNMIFAMVSGFLMLFLTDYAGIAAAVVGTLFLVARIWDAVDDPVQGFLIDRTRTKWGRFRPWLLIATIIGCVVSVMLFIMPALSPTGKIVYLYITYILYGIIFSFYDIPYWSLIPAMTEDTQERTRLTLPPRLMALFGGMIGGVLTLPLAKGLGGGNDTRGFMIVAIIFSVIYVITGLIGFFSTKERVAPVKKEHEKFVDSVFVIFKNVPLLLLFAASLCYGVGSALRGGMGVYYFKYVVGQDVLVSMFILSSALFTLVAMLLTPIISKKMGKKPTFILAMALMTFVYVVSYFIPASMAMLYILLNVIVGFGTGMYVIVATSMFADTVEYAEWKIGKRSESLVFSMVTFMAKLSNALGAAVTAFGLAAIGYIPNVQQTVKTLAGINQLMSIWPAVLGILAVVAILFYELTEKKYGEILKELEARRKSIKQTA